MNEWQTIDQDSHIIAVVMHTAFGYILVYYLKGIGMYVILVDEHDILHLTIVAHEVLHMILLNESCLLHDTIFSIGNAEMEEPVPFTIREEIVIQPFQLLTEVCNQLLLRSQLQIFVTLCLELTDEGGFQFRFTLICSTLPWLRFICCHDSRVNILCYEFISFVNHRFYLAYGILK